MIVCDKCMTNPADLGTMYIEIAGVRQGVDICRECFRKMFSDIEVARKAFCVQVNFDKDDPGSVEKELLAEKNREMLKDVPSRINGMVMPQFMPSEVVIGNQTWMAENLKVDDGKGGIYHNEDNGEVYYTFEAAKRIADTLHGWHLPTRDEWDTMMRVATELLASGTNTSGMSIKFSGSVERNLTASTAINDLRLYEYGTSVRLWTSDENVDLPSDAWYRYFDKSDDFREFSGDKSKNMFSVRLVKDT